MNKEAPQPAPRKARSALLASAASVPPVAADADDPVLTVQDIGKRYTLHASTVWAMVNSGALPAPFYPVPRSPRWLLSEVKAAIESNRRTPREARAARQAQRLAGERAA